MSRFLLIRHASCDPLGVSLAGRAPGVTLNARGRAEAARLAALLAPVPLDAIYTSPLERARETAAVLAQPRGQCVEVVDDLTELHFGNWTGQRLAELDRQSPWQRFNAFRSGTRIPAGELMAEAQLRVVVALERLRCRHPNGRVAVVTHGDIVKGALAYFMGIPLDLVQRLVIDPASVSVLEVTEWGATLTRLNQTDTPPF